MRRFLVPALLLVALGVFLALQNNSSTESSGEDSPGQTNPAAGRSMTPTTPESPPHEIPSKDSRMARFSDGSTHYKPAIEKSRQLRKPSPPGKERDGAEQDLNLVSQILDDYRFFFKENPMGSENAEIVAQLLGKNSQKIYFLDAAQTSAGTLNDRWGTPLVFHPLNRTEMGLRSMGPDRKLWTADDISLHWSGHEENADQGSE